MTTTFEEMAEQLKRIDEITLVEMLGLTSEDIVDRCLDLIEVKQDYLKQELEQFYGTGEEEDEHED